MARLLADTLCANWNACQITLERLKNLVGKLRSMPSCLVPSLCLRVSMNTKFAHLVLTLFTLCPKRGKEKHHGLGQSIARGSIFLEYRAPAGDVGSQTTLEMLFCITRPNNGAFECRHMRLELASLVSSPAAIRILHARELRRSNPMCLLSALLSALSAECFHQMPVPRSMLMTNPGMAGERLSTNTCYFLTK